MGQESLSLLNGGDRVQNLIAHGSTLLYPIREDQGTRPALPPLFNDLLTNPILGGTKLLSVCVQLLGSYLQPMEEMVTGKESCTRSQGPIGNVQEPASQNPRFLSECGRAFSLIFPAGWVDWYISELRPCVFQYVGSKQGAHWHSDTK